MDISLDSIVVGGTERVARGGAEGGTVMVAVGETGGADITLDGSAVTMAVDGTGRAAGGGRRAVVGTLRWTNFRKPCLENLHPR